MLKRKGLNLSRDSGKPSTNQDMFSRQTSFLGKKKESEKNESTTERLDEDSDEDQTGKNKEKVTANDHDDNLLHIKDDYDLVGFLLTCKKICSAVD